MEGASLRRDHFAGAPVSYQRLINKRSSSVIWVALFSGISLSAATYW
jgi:putative copper export protein